MLPSIHYDLVDLRLFANIADAQNLTRGAERSNLSVGAASTRIRNLEEALGTRLLFRRSQGVSTTPAGEALLARALRIFQELERLHGDLQAFSRGLKGTVRVFANTTAITELLPSVLGPFLATNPQIDIDLEERLSPEIAKAVVDGSIDIGILAGTVQTDGLEVFPYQTDSLVLVVPNSHQLSRRESVDFSEALPFSFVSLHRESAIHKFIDQIVMNSGTRFNTRIRVSGFESMCRMVEADVGLGILPASVATRLATNHNVSIVLLRDQWAVRDLKICVQRLEDLPAFARDLVTFLINSRPVAVDKIA